MKIVVIGNRLSVAEPGRVALAIANHVAENESDVQLVLASRSKPSDVAVYCRSTDESFAENVRFCKENDTPLLVLSTGFDMSLLDSSGVRYVHAPNSNSDVIEYMTQINNDIKELGDVAEFHLEEHHQASKKDVSGTAIQICKELGLDPTNIVSVRDFNQTNERFDLHLKEESAYAVHRFWAENAAGERSPTRDIVITDHSGYARGAIEFCRQLVAGNKNSAIV